MVENESLGENKFDACAWCRAPFAKKRWDQRFCSAPCAQRAKPIDRQTKLAWKDRPDREVANAARKARYHANRESILAKQRQARQENPDAFRAKEREDYRRNREAHIQRGYAYRKAHPEVRLKERQNAKRKRPWEWPLINARHRSQKKGLAFDLTREWCEQNWTGTCALSGLPFVFGTQTHFPFSPSIDRVRSSEGYTQNNCRFVLFAVNSFKGTGTDEQMLEIAQAIIEVSECRPRQVIAMEPAD
jgi:hypothetical protein